MQPNPVFLPYGKVLLRLWARKVEEIQRMEDQILFAKNKYDIYKSTWFTAMALHLQLNDRHYCLEVNQSNNQPLLPEVLPVWFPLIPLSSFPSYLLFSPIPLLTPLLTIPCTVRPLTHRACSAAVRLLSWKSVSWVDIDTTLAPLWGGGHKQTAWRFIPDCHPIQSTRQMVNESSPLGF